MSLCIVYIFFFFFVEAQSQTHKSMRGREHFQLNRTSNRSTYTRSTKGKRKMEDAKGWHSKRECGNDKSRPVRYVNYIRWRKERIIIGEFISLPRNYCHHYAGERTRVLTWPPG